MTQQIWFVVMSLVCGYALWVGGRPERLTAAACVGAWFLSRLVYNYQNWGDPQWTVLGVDVLFLLLLAHLAITTDRTWLLFAAAFQLLGVATHVAIVVDEAVRARAYVRGLVIWSYLVLAALAIGAWLHWRDQAELGEGDG